MAHYIIAPLRLVKGENQFPEFRDIFPNLFEAAKARAGEVWPGFTFGGALPAGKQYGIIPFRPTHVHGGGTATFVKTYGSQGSWRDWLNTTVPRDLLFAFSGIAFTDPNLIFAAVRMIIEDKKFPVYNIEEAHAYRDGFALIFKQDKGKEYVVPELQPYNIRFFQERSTSGSQLRVVPLGFELYKNKALVLSEDEKSN